MTVILPSSVGLLNCQLFSTCAISGVFAEKEISNAFTLLFDHLVGLFGKYVCVFFLKELIHSASVLS